MIRAVELRAENAEPGSQQADARATGTEGGAKRRLVYRITVQMDDGSYRTFSQRAVPAFAVGAKVKVRNGALANRT
jgi:hypothetical protein